MELAIYDYNAQSVRTVNLDGQVWFLAKDVCDVLEIKDTSQAMERLSVKQKLMRTLQVSGQGRETWLVNESGLYKLILRSNKKEAERFQDWITDDVLPTIRRTGNYHVNKGKIYTEQEAIRMIEKASFKCMAESIKQSNENERMKGFAYSTYNNMIYLKVIGKTAQQLKNEKGLKKTDTIKDYIDEKSLSRIENLERLVDSLLRIGYEFDYIKSTIKNISFNDDLIA